MIAGRGTLHPGDTSAARWRWAAGLGGAALVAAPAVALMPGGSDAGAVAAGAIGTLASGAVLAPPLVRAVARNRGLLVVGVLLALLGVWLDAGVRRAGGPPSAFGSRGIPYPFVTGYWWPGTAAADWPWRVGRVALLPLVLSGLCAVAGLVLLADSARASLGLAPTQWVPWRVMTARRERRGPGPWRTAAGIGLIGVAAFLGIGVADRWVAGDPVLQAMVLLLIGGWAAVLSGSPFLVGSLMRVDRDKAGRAREEERRRFAAHLHDSVLQTLALVQRQAHDPAAVARLARRQEHALRAWMAGEVELAGDTLAAALREVVAEVEDEHGVTVELTAIGDRALDRRGEALVAAAREALRNAARHGRGAPVFVFAEIGRSRVEVFVRDEGPGFDPAAVAAERRGIRDALVGRMALAGGRATIESAPGEGTEVALALDDRPAAR